MVVAWIAASLACQRAHDLGGIGWNSSKKMSIVVRPFVHGWRFSNRVADDDASSYGFVGFSSKWRTRFSHLRAGSYNRTVVLIGDRRRRTPSTVRKLWRRADLSGGSPNTVGDGTHLITLAPHDKRPDIEDTRRRSD